MTCPVGSPQAAQSPTTGDPATIGRVAVDEMIPHAAAVRTFERATGSVFVGLFAGALFDQAMLPAVSAALEDTGRIRNTPWLRAMRGAASDQIVFAGDPADRRAESERLVRLHRDVKGVGANGIRYSALNPELWNWILISTFFMYRNAAAVISGVDFTAAENQAVWDHFRERATDLQLPGKSRLIDSYDELCAYYDHIVAEKLEVTPTLECAVDTVLHPPMPDFLPALAAPIWKLTAPVMGHLAAVLSFGVMHPGVRALVPTTWTRRHDLEFTALALLVRLAYRCLPAAITDTPLVRNRRNYERIIAKYNGMGLTSFAPERPTAPTTNRVD